MPRKRSRRRTGAQPAQSPAQDEPEVLSRNDPRIQPNWEGRCLVCGQSPTLPLTGMCGPCSFGEAETIGGNWFQ